MSLGLACRYGSATRAFCDWIVGLLVVASLVAFRVVVDDATNRSSTGGLVYVGGPVFMLAGAIGVTLVADQILSGKTTIRRIAHDVRSRL